jgi:hypothetical protein
MIYWISGNQSGHIDNNWIRKMNIDTNAVLESLKDFQRNTVEYVYNKLYIEKTTNRFLIADEVGLGKTMVAKGIVAKAIEQLQADNTDRIDIVYICSNGIIAQQNINRLNLTQNNDVAISTRLTLLPIYGNLDANKINFISLTPGTSFDLKSRGGRSDERALLYCLIEEIWGIESEHQRSAYELLRVNQQLGRFKWRIGDIKSREISNDIVTAFAKELDNCPKLKTNWGNMLEWCKSSGNTLDHNLKQNRLEFIGTLREMLAMVCIGYLEPDIVILDEFQKFRNILHPSDNDETGIAHFAKQLFEYEDKKTDNPTKLLLLSATPYKMYTTSYEKTIAVDNHHQDFLETIQFLQHGKAKNNKLKQALSQFGEALSDFIRTGGQSLEKVRTSKQTVENLLLEVMVRTERLIAFTEENERNGMLRTMPSIVSDIQQSDLKAYVAFQKIAHQINHSDILEYWKSAPYLLNFMFGYRFKQDFDKVVGELVIGNKYSDRIALGKTVNAREILLSYKQINGYKNIDIANAKLRYLVKNYLDQQQAWKLLWTPPSLSYYRLAGAYEGREGLTKRLIFSAWRVVPRTIAMLLSYEVEHRIINAKKPVDAYEKKYTQQSDVRSHLAFDSHDQLNLMYPSFTLAKDCDPINLPSGLSRDEALHYTEDKVRELLTALNNRYVDQELGQEDIRWYWLAPILIDQHYAPTWLQQYLKSGEHWTYEETVAEAWQKELRYLRKYIEDASILLGTMPEDLPYVVAQVALGSPAICGLRAISRLHPNIDAYYQMKSAGHIAWHMRLLCNRPIPIHLIQGQYSSNQCKYWQAVVQYAIDGNLQATLDEYTHVLKDSLGLFSASGSELAYEIAVKLGHALATGSITLYMDEYNVNTFINTGKRHGIRTHFAMSLLEGKDDEITKKTGQSHQANLRDSFNSPFWPHILISTSIGQEGLDFHQHCHAIIHWNLPHNPVDLEQREGRVHRYKGHAIRRNIARLYGDEAREFVSKDNEYYDIWDKMFEVAVEKLNKQSDLMPFWIMPVDDPEQYTYIERYVPLIPLSRDNQKFARLQKMVGYYRMVFGQVRQEDMVSMLIERSDILDTKSIRDLQIDLSPPVYRGDQA